MSYATWALTSQTFWPGQRWRHHNKNSQMIFQSDDSLWISMSDCGEKIQEVKASQLVTTMTIFGHRSPLRRTSLRRRMTAVYGIGLRSNSECNTSTNRRGNSPWGRVAAWSCRLWLEAMVRSPIPADHCGRESPNWLDRQRPRMLWST
jgi:hypothetical protein